MKITIALVFLGCLSVNAEGVDGQTVTLSVRNVKLEKVFNEIRKQTGYVFFYDNRVLDAAGKVSISVRNAPVDKVLKESLEDEPLDFSIERKTVTIFKKGFSSVLTSKLSSETGVDEGRYAISLEVPGSLVRDPMVTNKPFVTITGSVKDAGGNPLVGVSVVVKGTTRGTSTNNEGHYTIDADPGQTLVFTFVGYNAVESVVGSERVVNIEMSASVASGLDEVVVVGYGTQKKSDLTGSISSVNAKMLDQGSISSVEQGLQGQAAGVRVVQTDGQPGGTSVIRIRGQNSINGGNDPLYVIDGVPVEMGNSGNTSLLASIDPADIQSIEILKDASAIAIYGARGSNGVVLITTRRGKNGQQNIDFKSSLGISKVEKEIKMLDSRQFAQIANERALNDGQVIPFPDLNAASAINTNWQDALFKTALTQDYSLNLSGGNDKTKYFASGSFFNQDGIIIGTGFKRGSFRLNLDQQAGKRLSFSTQINLSRSVANRTGDNIIYSVLGMPPTKPVRDSSGNFTSGDELLSYPFSDSQGDNPLIIANERLDKLTLSQIFGNFRTRYKFNDDFTAEVMLGTNQTSSIIDQYSSRLLRNIPDGSGSEGRAESVNYVIENVYHYNKDFGQGRQQLNATAGITWENHVHRSLSASSAGFVTDDFLNQNLGAGARFDAPQNGLSEWNLLSFLGRVNYTINNRYLFTVTGRRDGSSRFGAGNKWGFFPSAAFAWKIINEDFMSHITQISDLKLRLSWGKSGNQAIDPYQSLQRFESRSLIMGTSNVIGFVPDNLGNPNLKWETTEQYNAGLDLGLINNRILISFDLYKKRTYDLLASVNLPPNSGFATTLENIGSMQNQGAELNLGIDIIKKHKFSWNVNFNAGINKNKVTDLSKGADIIAPDISFVGPVNILRVGKPVSSFYGYKEDGLTEDGLIKYVDQNKDGVINSDDRVILGNPDPALSYGFASNISYGKFNLSIFIQGEGGRQLWNANKYYLATSFYRGSNNIAAVQDRWTQDNPNVNASYPKASANLNIQWSDRFVEDASYIRLKNVQLSYNIPFSNSHVKSARVFIAGQNLLTLTDYSWYNPDVNTFSDLRLGVDLNSYPGSRTITFGFEIGL